MRTTKRSILLFALGGALLLTQGTLFGGAIFLEGSDAAAFHGDGTYTDQLLTALRNTSSAPGLPVLVAGGAGFSGINSSVPFVYNGDTLAGQNLMDYSALYITSPGGCCNENDAILGTGGGTASINAFLAAGRTLGIADYEGGAAYAPILGFSDGLQGVTGYDGATATPLGLAMGFVTGPYSEGSWGHQYYDKALYATRGYSSLIDRDELNSGLLVNTSEVPEPATFVLLGLGISAIGLRRFRAAKQR